MAGIPLGLNAAFALGTGALGWRFDPYMAYNYLVEIDGLLTGGFSRVEGLECTIQTEDRVEGGENSQVHKLLKHTTYPNLVLHQGLTEVDSLWMWFDATRSGCIVRKSGTIMLLDDQRLPILWWDFRDALPVHWVGPTLDAATDGQVAVSRLEFVHRGLTRPPASLALSASRLAYQTARGRRAG